MRLLREGLGDALLLRAGTLLREETVPPMGGETRNPSASTRQLRHTQLHGAHDSASVHGLGGLPAGISLPSHGGDKLIPASGSARADALDRGDWSSACVGVAFLYERHHARSRDWVVRRCGDSVRVERHEKGLCRRGRPRSLGASHGLDQRQIRACLRNTHENMLNSLHAVNALQGKFSTLSMLRIGPAYRSY